MLTWFLCGQFYGGKETELGERLTPGQAADRVFGAVLLNDWSARDVQTWEYVPLVCAQNFATTISPWIVPMPFTCPGYTHDPPLLPYLGDAEKTNFDVPLTVAIRRKSFPPHSPSLSLSICLLEFFL